MARRLAPASGHVAGDEVMVEQHAHHGLAATHRLHHLLAAIDALEQEALQPLLGRGNRRREADQGAARIADVIGRLRGKLGDGAPALGNHVLDLGGDQPALYLVRLPAALDLGPALEHFAHQRADQWHIHQVGQPDQSGPQGIVDIVRVVSDVVGNGGGLRFEAGIAPGHQVGTGGDIVQTGRQRLVGAQRPALPVGQWPVMLENPLERLPAEIQPVMLGIAVLQPGHDPDRLHIVVEAAPLGHLVMQHAFAGMAEGRVAQVVRQRHCFRQILIQRQRAGDRARHLADLQRMGQPGAVVLAFVVEEYLGLVLQAPEGGRVHDAVAIPLELRAGRACSRCKQPATAQRGIRCIGGAFTHYAAKTLFIVV